MDQLVDALRRTLPQLPEATHDVSADPFIVTADPIHFWTRFIHCLQTGSPIIIMDPDWPGKWLAEYRDSFTRPTLPPPGQILIPTSGSSGRPKFCIHDISTLMTSAGAYRERFGVAGFINAIGLLPPYHIGGLMPVLRSAACGGQCLFADYRDVPSEEDVPFPLQTACLSLVPTQLHRMLNDGPSLHLLRGCGLILVGGAACPAGLMQQSRDIGLRLAPCYGSTESAAMVTALDPDVFLSGHGGVGTALPGMQVEVGPDERIHITSASICKGYSGDLTTFQRDPFITGDLGRLDSAGNLHIIGRADRLIISGGKNVHPEQVEAAALRSGLVDDAWCTGVPDEDWGQRVVLSVVARDSHGDLPAELEILLRDALPAQARPKEIRLVDRIERNAMGKRPSSRP